MRSIVSTFCAIFGIGCSPFVDRTVMGVPNLTQVAPRLWRMGQPADAAAWAYLKTQLGDGPVTVVKLNDYVEGVDTPPQGWTLLKAPIPPEDDKPWTVLVKPDPVAMQSIVNAIVDAYRRGDTVVWHCSHGRDRTSLVSVLVQMRLFGMSKRAAWDDMLAHGFRWELPDLDLYWIDDVK